VNSRKNQNSVTLNETEKFEKRKNEENQEYTYRLLESTNNLEVDHIFDQQ
jgi:hypothetical protein